MKIKILLIFAFIFTLNVSSQTALPIPSTLSGNDINLTMNIGTVSFLSGNPTQTFGFNGNPYLGPTLILEKGQNANIMVTNQIGESTSVHWHGMHVAAMNDGGPHTPILNGTTWNPQFTVLDKAATYWYHPHFHGKTAEHAIKGAAGLIIVKDPEEAALNLPRTYGQDDFPIIVQTAQFNNNNQLMPLGMQDSLAIVNGARANYGQSVFLNVPSQVIRLRLLNAAGERSFNFGFTANKSFKIIASDGGLLNAPIDATRIRVSPGERYEILVDLNGMNGQSIQLMSYASELPIGIQGGPTMPMPPGSPPMNSPINGIDFNLLQLNIGAQTVNPILTTPTTLAVFTPIAASASNITRSINMTALDPMSMDGPFYMNGLLFDMNRIDYIIPLNNTEIWQITNQTMVAHPFHIHNVQFYLLDRDGNTPPLFERGRKDEVLIYPNETISFITNFDTFEDDTMPFMYHCHILMHEDAGMMGQFLVKSNLNTDNENLVLTKNLNINPNPVNDSFSINIPESTLDYDIRITDTRGKVVLTIKSKNNMLIDVSSLSSGVYHVIVRNSTDFYSGKLIKN